MLCLSSCRKDKPDRALISPSVTGGVFVICEGSFGSGNAALYTINNTHDSTFGDLYAAANDQPLGDVFQSMKHIGDHLFLCINNSDKIIVVNAATLKLVSTIHVPKPRYILPVSASRAYVSSLYTNKVYIIDPQLFTLTDSISLPYKNTEGMCIANGSAFITPWDTACNKIYKTDPITNTTQAIQIGGYAPQAVLADKEQMLWVLAGNKTQGKPATLTRLDPSTGNILATYNFPIAADPLKPVWNPAKDTLYYIEIDYTGSNKNNGIYRMGIHDATLPAQPFITAATNQYYWGLGIDPATGYIYVGDPKGFIQKGNVMSYKPGGSLISTLSVGLGPGSFYFGE